MSTDNERGIVVMGRGVVQAPSTSAVLSLGVSVLRETAKEAAGATATAANNVVGAILATGIDRSAVTTTGFSVHSEFDHTQRGRRLLGYRVNQDLAIRIADVSGIGQILDDAVAAGGDDVLVHGISFQAEDNAGAESEARRLAWEDAMARASHYAELSGHSLGEAVSIQEHGMPHGPITMATKMIGFDEATSIEPGTTEIAVGLRVHFSTV